MKIVISPAKTFDFEPQNLNIEASQPKFTKYSSELIEICKNFQSLDLQKLMKVSADIASLNVSRYKTWQIEHNLHNSKMAVFAFRGDVYRGLDADNLSTKALGFAQNHLRILSGLYGILQPLDLIQPYRLEMGTKLANANGKTLYDFWGDLITKTINQEENKLLINLASDEYFKVIKPSLLKCKIVKPVFLDAKQPGEFKQIGLYAKKARGLMTRFILENEITKAEDLKDFDYENYSFDAKNSDADNLIFKREHF